MTLADIASLRLVYQQITTASFSSPVEVAAHLGALQAQEYTQAKWALGLRLPDATDASIEQSIVAGDIVRTHILRPTWHFVAAADIRWMMALTAPQIAAQFAARDRDLGLDAHIYKRTNDLIVRALEGGHQRTRQELAAAIEQGGVVVNSSRMVHIMMRAELDAVVCNGVRRGKEQTYALLDERIPPGKQLERDLALAELARRYFHSHAPATLQDFIWWSGLRVGDARAALEMVKSGLISAQLDSLTYWMPKNSEIPTKHTRAVHLLPAFDEFLVSYKERGASLDPSFTTQTITSNGIFKPVVVVNGRVAGVWSRVEKKNSLVLEKQIFIETDAEYEAGVAVATKRFERFFRP